jgi:Mg/Co/Ni transporter MgtE
VALAVPDYPDLADRTVSEIMSRDVVEVRPDDPLEDIERRFSRDKARHLVVVDPEGSLVGVIAWEDLIKHLEDGKLRGVILQAGP